MFGASHFITGSVIHDAIKDEPLAARILLGLGGCFVSHWLLDTVPVFHEMELLSNPGKAAVVAYNVAVIGGICYATRRKRRWWIPSERALWGFAAWLLWDAWWLVEPQGGPHRLTEIFNHVNKWTDPRSFIIEALWILFFALISLPSAREGAAGKQLRTILNRR